MKFQEALASMLQGQLTTTTHSDWRFRIHNNELQSSVENGWLRDSSSLGWLLEQEWSIYTPITYHTFEEAIAACKRGKTVKFSTWHVDTMRYVNGRFVFNNSIPVELLSYFPEPKWIILETK